VFWLFLHLSVHPTQYREKYWTYFHQTFNIGAFWDKDEHFVFWGEVAKVRGHSRSSMLENDSLTDADFVSWLAGLVGHFWALLT